MTTQTTNTNTPSINEEDFRETAKDYALFESGCFVIMARLVEQARQKAVVDALNALLDEVDRDDRVNFLHRAFNVTEKYVGNEYNGHNHHHFTHLNTKLVYRPSYSDEVVGDLVYIDLGNGLSK